MLIGVLATVAIFGAGDPDGVIATAPEGNEAAVLVDAVAPVADAPPSLSVSQALTPHGLTTDEQIDRWISERTAGDAPFSEDAGLGPVDDRQVHGEVSAAVGTGDFSAYSASVSLPLGENGRMNLSYSQSKNGYGYPGYGYPGGYTSYGLGVGYGAPVYRDRISAATRSARPLPVEERDASGVLRIGREPPMAD